MNEQILEKYENLDQRDFLSMSKEEWKKFVDELRGVVLEPKPDLTRVETFLAERGLYVWLDLTDLRTALEDWRGWRLYEVAVSIAETLGMNVVAAIQPPTFGMAGHGYAFPEERERELFELLEKNETFEELALSLMEQYGPCILVETDDHIDVALLCCTIKG
jgi:hypothetical protein